MKSFRHLNLVIIILALVVSVSACKSSKKAAEAARAAEEKARIEREATARKEDEARKKQEAEEKAARDAQARQQQATEKESTPKAKLSQYFEAIAGSSDVTAANNNIQEALGMFASDESLVLVIISGTGDQKDYDKPTTIKKYLNYLKDQKKNVNRVESLQFDSSGKITELELSKN